VSSDEKSLKFCEFIQMKPEAVEDLLEQASMKQFDIG
jgi:hypothetical protein